MGTACPDPPTPHAARTEKSAWTEVSGPPIPPVGYAAMIMGVVLSLLVGCGLMALLFYSSRYGYDEQHPPDELG
jgi:hypothetical protein